MPAYTHLQRAEPVLVAHWLLAYVEMFLRDRERLADCRKRLNQCPLGSGAVAGATLPLDRAGMANELGFDASDGQQHGRDQRPRLRAGVRAGAVVCSALHLSRWAEEMILFATTEYGFITLPEAYSTGSSAMPQKKNPDALELIRGKAARVFGDADCTVHDSERAAAGLQQRHAGDAAAGLRGCRSRSPASCGWRRDSWRVSRSTMPACRRRPAAAS